MIVRVSKSAEVTYLDTLRTSIISHMSSHKLQYCCSWHAESIPLNSAYVAWTLHVMQAYNHKPLFVSCACSIHQFTLTVGFAFTAKPVLPVEVILCLQLPYTILATKANFQSLMWEWLYCSDI